MYYRRMLAENALWGGSGTTPLRKVPRQGEKPPVCLEAVLLPEHVEPVERIARARALRAGLPKDTFEPEEIDAFKREGRA